MDTRDKILLSIVVAMIFMVLFWLGILLGHSVAEATVRSEAIEAGVARYTVDPKTGETTFEWVTSDR